LDFYYSLSSRKYVNVFLIMSDYVAVNLTKYINSEQYTEYAERFEE